MKLMAASFVRQEEKRRFGVGARPRRVKPKTETETKTEPEADANAQPVDSTELRTQPGGASASVASSKTEADANAQPVDSTELRTPPGGASASVAGTGVRVRGNPPGGVRWGGPQPAEVAVPFNR